MPDRCVPLVCASNERLQVTYVVDGFLDKNRDTLGELFVQPPFVEAEFAFTPLTLLELERRASKEHIDGSLAFHLARIRHCESLMAPASALFLFVLAKVLFVPHQDRP